VAIAALTIGTGGPGAGRLLPERPGLAPLAPAARAGYDVLTQHEGQQPIDDASLDDAGSK